MDLSLVLRWRGHSCTINMKSGKANKEGERLDSFAGVTLRKMSLLKRANMERAKDGRQANQCLARIIDGQTNHIFLISAWSYFGLELAETVPRG